MNWKKRESKGEQSNWRVKENVDNSPNYPVGYPVRPDIQPYPTEISDNLIFYINKH